MPKKTFYFVYAYFISVNSFPRWTNDFSSSNSMGVLSSTTVNSLIMEVFRNITLNNS